MAEIRLIASDLDGTLLTNQKGLTPLNRRAIEEAVSRGIHFVPCTGRAYSSIPKELLTVPGIEYAITSNGAAVYSTDTGSRIYECLMSRESVEAILAMPQRENVVMEAFVGGVPYSEERYIAQPRRFGATQIGEVYIKKTRTGVPDVRAHIAAHMERIDSIVFVCPDADIRRELRGELAVRCKDIHITSSFEHLTEVGHKDAGKGNTLGWLLQKLSLRPENAMTFGDAENDLDMIASAGYGVAMGNAARVCKRAAYMVTDSNEEDGVGKAIFRMLGSSGCAECETEERKEKKE